MKLDLNCGTCMVNQAINAMEIHNIEFEQQIKILRSVIEDVARCLDQPTPSHFQTILLHKLAKYMQLKDIYATEKEKQNKIASELIPLAIRIISRSLTPMFTAALFAVEGNSIDQLFFSKMDFENKINSLVTHSFAIDHYQKFESMLENTQKIVYLLDNAGEIFFDRLFIQTFQKWRLQNNHPLADVTCIVKGGSILNDATTEDAEAANLNEIARVVSSGTNHLGSALEKISEQAKREIQGADMIISKGQANFETLEDVESLRGKTFFLLKAKCIHIASFLNVPLSSSIFFGP